MKKLSRLNRAAVRTDGVPQRVTFLGESDLRNVAGAAAGCYIRVITGELKVVVGYHVGYPEEG